LRPKFYRESFNNELKEAFEDIVDKLSSYALVIFIRGTPSATMCKSSKFLVDQLNRLDIKFKSYNIQEDFKLKEWLKFYANWPRILQLFITGKFIGVT
jgi:monothiol glutaredoxin